jgi:L-lactate dehydrogenase
LIRAQAGRIDDDPLMQQADHGGGARIVVVGAGNVGATFAYALVQSGLASEIVLVDRNEGRAEGEAMDLSHAVPFSRPTRVRPGSLDDCADAAITVITAGAGQKAGETRMDLARSNDEILGSIVPQVAEANQDGIIVVTTNPVDVLTARAVEWAQLPPGRVFGTGTILDTARFRALLADRLRVDPRSIHAFVIGEHGDSEVPVWSSANVAGVSVRDYCASTSTPLDADEMRNIGADVRNAAYEIIERKGATQYGVGAGMMRLVEAILRDQHTVLSVSSPIPGFYGISDVCLSLPAVIGRNGVERVIEIPLSADEQGALRRSADILRDAVAELRRSN